MYVQIYIYMHIYIYIGPCLNTETLDFSNFSNLLPEILAVLPTGCRDESTLYTHNMQSLYK